MHKAVFLLILLLAGCTSVADTGDDEPLLETIVRGTTGMGDVEIQIRPIQLDPLMVELSANTHSVDLSQHTLTEVMRVEHEGQLTQPVSAPQLAGHHVNGIVEFPIGVSRPFTIRITEIPSEEKVYSWK